VAQAAFRPAGGGFGTPAPVSDGTSDAQALSTALTESGDGVIAFQQGAFMARIAHARGFDSTPPQLSGVSIPATAGLGETVPFAAQAFDTWGPVTFGWNFGDGTADGASPTHAFGAAGDQAVTVTATDSAGNSSSQSGTVSVPAPAPPGPVPGSLPVAPLLTQLAETNSVFRVGPRPTTVRAAARRRPVGTTFRYTLNVAASVSISITRELPGRRSGKRCVKPTKRLARAKRCTRLVGKGTLVRNSKAGRNNVAFSGRIGKRALAPGRYRATFTATASGKKSPPKALRFKIVRR
jgi:hypothetical protein